MEVILVSKYYLTPQQKTAIMLEAKAAIIGKASTRVYRYGYKFVVTYVDLQTIKVINHG